MKNRSLCRPFWKRLADDSDGAVLVEAAFAIPLIAVILSGTITYALYFMSAHSLQTVANDGARASIAGIDAEERRELVDRTIEQSMLHTTLIDPEAVVIRTDTEGDFYTVSLEYDASSNPLMSTSLVPLPDTRLVRSATVQIPTY